MTSLQTIGAGISAAFKSIALSALTKSDTLNSIANRLTGGSINRDTLATSALHAGMRAGTSAAVDAYPEALGVQTKELKPHIDKFLQADSTADVQDAFKGLMHALLPKPQLPHPAVAAFLDDAIDLAGDFAGEQVGEKLLEKTLATMVAKHGREVLADRLQLLVGDFASHRLMEIIDHGILNKPEWVMEDNSKVGYLADALYFNLSGGDTKPFEDRGVSLLKALPDGSKSVLDFVRGFVPEGGNIDAALGWLESAAKEQPFEKIVATMAAAHGKDALLEKMNAQFESTTGSPKYARMLTNMVDRAIISNPDHVQEDSKTYGLLADTLHAFLSGDTKPLEDRTVALLQKGPEGAKEVLDFIRTFVPAEGSLSTALGWMESISKEQPLEKILATMANAHGKEHFVNRLNAQITSLTGNARLGEVITSVIDRAILSDEALVQKDSQIYGYLSDTLHAALTGDTKPLKDRSVQLVQKKYEENTPQIVQAGVSIAVSSTKAIASGTHYLLSGTVSTVSSLAGGAWSYLRGSASPATVPAENPGPLDSSAEVPA
ncbi:hypothetical protein [Diaphorobacter caeni]|uniref:hypothetical protein n=1 Tax=Diaphorobacter caeni TaxID=2784387 RepID=UPI00188EFA90|nr:hypothetical protein [Diaphorobacter caeni]MBF5006103.1 hypothetical protein [Diaphorobacter caeni]